MLIAEPPPSIALQIAAYSFVGVEIPAITAAEAHVDRAEAEQPNAHGLPARQAMKAAVAFLPLGIGITYLVAGVMTSLNVDWDDARLPEQSWSGSAECVAGQSTSAFVLSAQDSGIPYLDQVFTVFLLLTAWSSANTALYAASRTLHGMTQHAGGWRKNISNTVRWSRAPALAILMSCFFIWVPFLQTGRKQGLNLVR